MQIMTFIGDCVVCALLSEKIVKLDAKNLKLTRSFNLKVSAGSIRAGRIYGKYENK